MLATCDWLIPDRQGDGYGLTAGSVEELARRGTGLVVTVTLNNAQSFSHAFSPRLIDGVPSNLNWGYVGFGSENARARLDNIQVKVLERPFTLITNESFNDGAGRNYIQRVSYNPGSAISAVAALMGTGTSPRHRTCGA